MESETNYRSHRTRHCPRCGEAFTAHGRTGHLRAGPGAIEQVTLRGVPVPREVHARFTACVAAADLSVRAVLQRLVKLYAEDAALRDAVLAASDDQTSAR